MKLEVDYKKENEIKHVIANVKGITIDDLNAGYNKSLQDLELLRHIDFISELDMSDIVREMNDRYVKCGRSIQY